MRLKTIVIINLALLLLVVLICLLYQPLTGRVLLRAQITQLGEGCAYVVIAIWLFYFASLISSDKK